ncbi:WD40 repeat protein [Mycobacterium sp. BK558]|nr:WD40 repeat protein [Mycobacterium sp. BK558]
MQLDDDNPWPGLASFEEDAAAFFFGRDREANSLLAYVLDAQVTVLYGRSGLGKTSLLRAALFPALRERHFLPIYVRLDLQPDAESLSWQLRHAVCAAIRAEVPDAAAPADSQSLWEYLHRRDFELWSARNYPLIPVIVLDQFEELFTLGARVPDLVQEFMNDLGDLAENRIPAAVAARVEQDEAHAAEFHLRSQHYKLLVTLREDFLPDLEEWCRLIPALGRSRLRLLPLKPDAALDAVIKPAAHMMTDILARRVVSIIAGDESHHDPLAAGGDRPADGNGAADVEPALLSLFCRELNEERKRRGQASFDDTLVEHAKRDILSNYYLSCVHDLPPRVADFIESELITEKGFRDSYAREDAVPARLTDDELAQLVSARLLRLEDYHGAQRIELTHDVLTGVVREHRDQRRAEEQKAALAARAEQDRKALEEAAAAREAELTHERDRRIESERTGRRLKRLSAVLALACVVALVMAVVAFVNWRGAATARNDAAARFREATAQRLYGESQLMLAGLRPGRSDDVLGMQELLAAMAIPLQKPLSNNALLAALNQERDLLKVIDTSDLILSVAFNPDGSRIAAASADKTIHLYDTASGQPIGQPLAGGDSAIKSVAFSRDGTKIASGCVDGTVRLWDAATGQPIGAPMNGGGLSVALSPDGTKIASAGADIRVWEAATGREIGSPMLGHDGTVTSVAFSPDGRRIVSGGFDKTVRLWDATTGQPIGQPLSGHDQMVLSVAFSPDGTKVVSAGGDIRIWDAATGQPVGGPLGAQGSTYVSVSFSPDGRRIAAGAAEKSIQLFDVFSGQQVGVFTGHRSAVEAVAFSTDGRRLVSGGDDKTVRVWDATSGQPMLGHQDTVGGAGFSADGKRIISGSADGTVRQWDAMTGSPLGEPVRVDDGTAGDLYPLGDQRLLSIGDKGDDKVLRVWDASSRRAIGEPLILPPGPLGSALAAWTHNGDKLLVAITPQRAQLFDVATMRPVGRAIDSDTPLIWFDLSPDAHTAATSAYDGSVRLWSVDTGKSLSPPMTGNGGLPRVAFSPDGHLLIVAGTAGMGTTTNTLRLWDTRTFEPVGNTMTMDSAVLATTVSPDGRIIASGSADGTIQLWNADDQTEVGAPLTGHTAVVTDLDFSADGTRLLSGSADHTLRLWPVPISDTKALCAKITHVLSRKQWAEIVSPAIDYVPVCPGLPETVDAN